MELYATHLPLNEQIQKHITLIPKHYSIRESLKRNEQFLDELIRVVQTQKKEKTVLYAQKEIQYQITTCNTKIENVEIETVIDTGANLSIVSEELVKFLNLPQQLNNKCQIKMADNTYAVTGGLVNLKIQINKDIYKCAAVVLKNASQKLLLGTDFLSKHGVKIDLEKNELTINMLNYTNRLPIKCFETENLPIRTFNSKKNYYTLYAKKNTEIPPGATIPLQIDGANLQSKFTCNNLLKIENNDNSTTQTIQGVTDLNNFDHSILVSNTDNVSKIIKKGQKVGTIYELNKAHAIDLNDIKVTYEKDELFKCYKGDEEYRKQFQTMITKLLDAKRTHKPLNVFHEIHLTTNDQRIYQRPYRSSNKEKENIKIEVNKMLEEQIITESNSQFCSPVIMVKKKDGSYRFCVDYRALNKITIKDTFPLPIIDETLENLSKAKIFSKVDLKSGYWQIPVAENDRYKTAFCTQEGLYEFKKMPFGLTNARLPSND